MLAPAPTPYPFLPPYPGSFPEHLAIEPTLRSITLLKSIYRGICTRCNSSQQVKTQTNLDHYVYRVTQTIDYL